MMMENDIIKKPMENKKISAVEWLYKEMYSMFCTPDMIVEFQDMLEEAKAMHKQEIIDTFGVGCQVESTRLIGYQDMAEQYYNETYGK